MLRKRLPTPLFKELYLTSTDPNTGKDFFSPLTDAGHTSTFSKFFKNGDLTGKHSLLQGTRVTGPSSLLDDDTLHVTPNDQGVPLSDSTGSISGIVPNGGSALGLRPRRTLRMRSTGARRLHRYEERQQLPSVSDADSTLSNNAAVNQVTELSGLDAVQSTSTVNNLANELNLGDLGSGLGLIKRKVGLTIILLDLWT